MYIILPIYYNKNQLVMHEKHENVLISILDAMGGQVNGRTVLQKLSYFISVKTAIDLQHTAHYYGPYSRTIASTLEDLSAAGFIKEEGWITTNDRVAYNYRLTPDGESIVKDIKVNSSGLYKKVSDIVHTCTKITSNDPGILSWAAKVHYIARQKKGGEITYQEIKDIGESLGWSLSEAQIDSAGDLLKELGLVKTS